MGVESMSQLNLSVSAQEKLLTPSEVATLFRVDPKTVTRWAKAGKLTSTLGDSAPHSSITQTGENRL